MLWIYTRQFQDAKNVKEIFQKYNLEIEFNEYFGGCTTGINGKKR